MNTYCYVTFLFISVWLFAGCKSDDGEAASITVTDTTTEILYPTVDQKMTITFTASADWSASCSANWLTVSPASGKAGSQTITVTTTQINRPKASRSAVVTISAGSAQRSVNVVQSGDYGTFDQKVYSVGAEGGAVAITFTSNIDDVENMTVAYNSETDWIHWDVSSGSRSGEEWRGKLTRLVVDANESRSPRTAIYVLALLTGENSWVGLDTCYVQQAGLDSGYESSDFSADGEVTVMQRATQGKGISIVLMGDGFADKEILDGTYQTVMKTAMEHLFSEEPVKSLRDYFSVYAVTAVSKSDNVGGSFSTVFSTVPDPQSSNIEADTKAVDAYAKKAVTDLTDALSVVILNSSEHKGVTYLYHNSKTKVPLQYAIALCPVIESLESEQFRLVLVHEAIGHGLAKLGDEYGYKENGAPSQDVIDEIARDHQYGWLRNVDTTDDVTKVDWHNFIGDSRFDNEYIGVYEGGYTYTIGAYRPTPKSMMNGNDSPFNAPSRKAIYDRVMSIGEGRPESTYAEFAAFDEQHKPQQWSYLFGRSTRSETTVRPAPPVRVYREW